MNTLFAFGGSPELWLVFPIGLLGITVSASLILLALNRSLGIFLDLRVFFILVVFFLIDFWILLSDRTVTLYWFTLVAPLQIWASIEFGLQFTKKKPLSEKVHKQLSCIFRSQMLISVIATVFVLIQS